jgi:hypothetical protein
MFLSIEFERNWISFLWELLTELFFERLFLLIEGFHLKVNWILRGKILSVWYLLQKMKMTLWHWSHRGRSLPNPLYQTFSRYRGEFVRETRKYAGKGTTKLSFALRFAPFAMRMRTTSRLTFMTAKWRGVYWWERK